jgi:DHA1 family multidrug resistance protein B-like MFS transporter
MLNVLRRQDRMEVTEIEDSREKQASLKLRELHPNIKLRIGESFLSTLVGSMVFPFMAIYLSLQFGARTAGVLLLFNVLGTFIGGGLGGFAADRMGRRRTMLTAETARFCALVLMGAANSQWWHMPEMTYAAMLVINASAALSLPAVQAMIVESSGQDNRALVYSTIYWINNAALLIGSLAGAVLFRDHMFALCIGMSAASLVSFSVLLFFIKESWPANQAKSAGPSPEKGVVNASANPQKPQGFMAKYSVVFRDWAFLSFVTASALGLSLEYLSKNYTSVRLDHEFGMRHYKLFGGVLSLDGIRMYGVLIAVNALVIIVMSFSVVRLARRISGDRIMAAGVFVCAVGYAVLGVSNQPWVLIPFMALAACGQVLFATMKQTYLAFVIPADNRGPYMAVSGMEFLVANVVGSTGLILGTWLPSWVMGAMFLGMGTVSVVLLVLLFARKADPNALARARAVQNTGESSTG